MPVNPVEVVVADAVARVRDAVGTELKAAVLFGSAAEDRMRATSDVNIVFVLGTFNPANVEALGVAVSGAAAAVRLNPMFILESEIADAAAAFAVKFADILKRRRVLFGADPFVGLKIDRAAQLHRLRQELINLTLRLRRGLVMEPGQPGHLVAMIADAAAPLRSAAGSLRDLRGESALAPHEALAAFIKAARVHDGDGLLARITDARAQRTVSRDVALTTITSLIAVAQAMREQAQALAGAAGR